MRDSRNFVRKADYSWDSCNKKLLEALDAYDKYVIRLKGEGINRNDLNRPEKWPCFMGQSDNDVSEDAKREMRETPE